MLKAPAADKLRGPSYSKYYFLTSPIAPQSPNPSGDKTADSYGRWPMPPSRVRVSPLMNLKSGLASCTTTRPISFSTSP